MKRASVASERWFSLGSLRARPRLPIAEPAISSHFFHFERSRSADTAPRGLVEQQRARAMDTARERLSHACLLVSKATGHLEAACAEQEAAQGTVKRWVKAATATTTASGSDDRDDAAFDPVGQRARDLRRMNLGRKDAPAPAAGSEETPGKSVASASASARALPAEFVALRNKYVDAATTHTSSGLLDIRDSIRASSTPFMAKLSARRGRGRKKSTRRATRADGEECDARVDDLVAARATLAATRWIERALEGVNWRAMKRESSDDAHELCDVAYTIGCVVRLWKECAPRVERLSKLPDARAATRRDAFLLALCASKKLSYPDRSEYAALETTAMREVTRSMESDGSFLTWLPEQCWQGGVPPPPPDVSLKSPKEAYVEVASAWQRIQSNLFMAQLESSLYHDLIPDIFVNAFESGEMREDELAWKLRAVRSIVMAGKRDRCATIGVYEDVA